MPDGTNVEIKRGRKFAQVLAGAREIFLRDGFEGASVDDIARAAGVSKATLYSYFPDKRLLFMEMAKVECARQANHVMDTIDRSAPMADILRSVSRQIIDLIMSDFARSIFRICVGESTRFPDLGREFYTSGPQMGRKRLTELLRIGVSRGDLRITDLDLAAEQFAQLCKADLFDRMVFNMADTFTDVEKERVIHGAVDMFMARYGT
ncbi:transcriptional regulator, TetR family [Cognatiyoonia koreensis]|uniref:Transcriptional regulator, TetR family n=1 Tax=Cognatiyoonia koreensis TaxID=364200 RepID=A0A1I0RES2_9RHOB|nr:TetR/AcrR family transcriptional regulator [Cognatiyoonia koreensis]SEW39142.1 transcriptional regulator, TetR family [Cognatiyoonia koreensis]